ncbi:uncharacterized protein YecE (DUF72 family) [Thermonema lapsum]|uniref:Uncharacterized protein YecE (DUF72 family) n=1 Tax=Thermonema lapsum TaxID=28195 RepID=A0A846MNK4_9BACT|nr:DUF72 domain-containing protein [Thermonema lapsum]NIK72990.1 uncharacterized protein YecE (DUF72 family) [Thermonema lapsum]
MEFGKVNDISSIDFSLPPDAAFNRYYLSKAAAAHTSTSWYVGCPIWVQKEWVGRWYPPQTPSQKYLEYYSRQFNTIELNSTHYALPASGTLQRWVEQSPEGFRFCPKVPQSISHQLNGPFLKKEIEAFAAFCSALGNRLGTPFMQLPPGFSTRDSSFLLRFLDLYPFDKLPLSIEFRHPSWFKYLSRTADKLHSYGAGLVITDVAGRRDVLHMGLSNHTAMIRFVGNDLHPTDYSRIDEWVERLAQWQAQGVKQVFFFVHEPDNVQAPELAAYLIHRLNQRLKLKLKEPQRFDTQQNLF